MEKFTLKIGKELRCYELDEDKKQLHITVLFPLGFAEIWLY